MPRWSRDLCRSMFVKKRRWEYNLITSAIVSVVPSDLIGKLQVMEYGCGPGVGVQSLSQLGDLLLTDIYRDPSLDLPDGVEFRIADIHETDFKDGEFDVLVSNQVLEYLDLKKAFQEMK